MSTRLRCAALLLLGALATGCATDGGSTDAGVDPTAEPTNATPAPEDTGHEKPAPTMKKPKVNFVGGPAGDGGEADERNDDGSVCQFVNWLGGQDEANLGAGIEFRLTGIGLDGAKRSSARCPGYSCTGFTFDSNSDRCVVAVLQGKSKGTLTIRGEVRCSATAEECREFRSNLKTRTIPIDPAPDVEPTDGEEPPIDEEPGPETSDPEPPPAE